MPLHLRAPLEDVHLHILALCPGLVSCFGLCLNYYMDPSDTPCASPVPSIRSLSPGLCFWDRFSVCCPFCGLEFPARPSLSPLFSSDPALMLDVDSIRPLAPFGADTLLSVGALFFYAPGSFSVPPPRGAKRPPLLPVALAVCLGYLLLSSPNSSQGISGLLVRIARGPPLWNFTLFLIGIGTLFHLLE